MFTASLAIVSIPLPTPDGEVARSSGFICAMKSLVILFKECSHHLRIKILVFNNSALGMVKLEMEVAGFPDW
jgi:pyruvate dehydrogenase (quinone)